MADTLSVIVKTQLELDRKAEINKLNSELEKDTNARVKLVAELEPQSFNNIKSQLDTLNKGLALNINTVNVANIDSRQLQDNINQATANAKATVPIYLQVDKSKFEDPSEYMREIVKKMSDPNVVGKINASSILKGLKDEFKIGGKEIESAVGEFVQHLKLSSGDIESILPSYENLVDQIRNTIENNGVNASKLLASDDFEKNLTQNIARMAEEYSKAGTASKQATQAMTEGLKQAEQAAEQTKQAVSSILSDTSGSNYTANNQSLLNSIQQFEKGTGVIENFKQAFKDFQVDISTDTSLNKQTGELERFTAIVKSSTGEIERFKYTFDAESNFFKLDNINAADTAVQRITERTIQWQNKVSSASKDAISSLEGVKTAWENVNSGKYVSSDSFTSELNKRYDDAIEKAKALANADSKTFGGLQTEVNTAIKSLNRLVSEYHDAEKVATTLRAKDYSTVLSNTTSNIQGFESDINRVRPLVALMSADVEKLKASISKLNNSKDEQQIKTGKLKTILNDLDNAERKFQSFKKLFQDFGKDNWYSNFKSQIDGLATTDKIAVYREYLKSIREEWKQIGDTTGLKNISNAFGALSSQLRNNLKPDTLNGWVQRFDELLFKAGDLKNKLDSQVSVQKQIYQIQSEIAKLNVDPEGNANQIARRQAELDNLQKQKSKLETILNIYVDLVPIEQQEAYVTKQTVEEEEKLLDVKAKIADIQNKNTAQAFDKANTQIVKENLDKIVSAYREIGTLSNQITKGNIGANEVAVNKELIALKEESIKLAIEDLEKNGLLTNEIRNQIEAEKQRVAESQKKVQAQVADTAVAQQAKALEQQAKAVHTYTSQIQNDLNQLNKMSANTVFTTNTSNPQVQTQKTAIQDLIKEYEKLKATMNSNMSTADLEKARARLEELRTQLKSANTDMATLRSSMQSDKSAQKLAGDISLLTAQIKEFRKANSKSEARFGSEYDSLLQKLKQNPDVSGLYAIRQQFRQLQGDVRSAGLTGTTFFDKLKADAAKFSAWFGVAAPGMLVAREIRQMFSDVVELDTAIVDLKKTFQGTSEQLQDFYYESNNVARQLGVTTQEVITQAGAWSRLGYSTAEQATAMAKLSSQMAMISPGLSTDTAQSGLVSIMKSYSVEVDDVTRKILDNINIIGNNFATSNAEIITGLQKSSAAMAAMGSSLEENIGLFTAGYFCQYVQKCA